MDSMELVPLAICSQPRLLGKTYNCSAEITLQAPISFLQGATRRGGQKTDIAGLSRTEIHAEK